MDSTLGAVDSTIPLQIVEDHAGEFQRRLFEDEPLADHEPGLTVFLIGYRWLPSAAKTPP